VKNTKKEERVWNKNREKLKLHRIRKHWSCALPQSYT